MKGSLFVLWMTIAMLLGWKAVLVRADLTVAITCPVEGKTRVSPWFCTALFSEALGSWNHVIGVTNGAASCTI